MTTELSKQQSEFLLMFFMDIKSSGQKTTKLKFQQIWGKLITTEINLKLHYNCFAVGKLKKKKKNAPARESNPGFLVYETSAYLIEPPGLVR